MAKDFQAKKIFAEAGVAVNLWDLKMFPFELNWRMGSETGEKSQILFMEAFKKHTEKCGFHFKNSIKQLKFSNHGNDTVIRKITMKMG